MRGRPCPLGPGHSGAAQPARGQRRSQSPRLPDGPHAAPHTPAHALALAARPATHLQFPPGAEPLSSGDSPRFACGPDHRAGLEPRGESQHRPGLCSDGGPGAGPRRGGAGRGGWPSRSLAPPGGRGARARGRPAHAFLRVPQTPRRTGAAAPAWSASALEGTGPHGWVAAAGGVPSATHPPGVRCGRSRGAEARPRPRKRGRRSRREAWGGGFGEGGERGSSDELLPSLTATQRPTSSSYFYFLWVLLTFKMPAPLVLRRAPGPPPLCKKAGFQHRTSSLRADIPPSSAGGYHWAISQPPKRGEGSSPESRPSSGPPLLPPTDTLAGKTQHGIAGVPALPCASFPRLQNEGKNVVPAALARKE